MFVLNTGACEKSLRMLGKNDSELLAKGLNNNLGPKKKKKKLKKKGNGGQMEPWEANLEKEKGGRGKLNYLWGQAMGPELVLLQEEGRLW